MARHISRRWPNYLLFLSLIAVGGSLYGLSLRTDTLSFDYPPATAPEPEKRQSALIGIRIPAIRKSLPIVTGYANDNAWSIEKDSANHLESSLRPGEQGNIVIYGHNSRKIFRDLFKIDIGEEIVLKTADNKLHTYKVTNKLTVSPDQVSLVAPTDDEVLTIYTCTGFLDRKRLVVRAEPLIN